MKEVKALLIKKIIEQGFPVIAIFDYMDASASIYAKSENEVIFGFVYGEELQEGNGTTIQDITPEGLFHLFNEGVRPGAKYWEESLSGVQEEGS